MAVASARVERKQAVARVPDEVWGLSQALAIGPNGAQPDPDLHRSSADSLDRVFMASLPVFAVSSWGQS